MISPQIQKIREVCETLIEAREKAAPEKWEVEDHRDNGDWRTTGLIWARTKGAYHPGETVCQMDERKLGAESAPETIAKFEGNAAFIALAANHSSQLAKSLLIAVEALEKGRYLIVEDECDECGTFSTVKYHIKPIEEALEQITSQLMGEE